MKQHIYYSSTAYQNIYSENKNSSFRSDIVAHNLDYIADGQLEAALVNLTFTLKEKILNKNLQLGVRSSLQLDANIRASNYDNIIYTFTLLASLKTSLNYQVPPTQYIYFSTTKEHLSRAKFEIINLETNELFGEIDNSSSPTLIEIAVKPKTMSSFSMILESGDEKSRNIFNKNTNMNFTTQLPERLELQGETWSVICKGAQITGSLYNIQDNSFSLKYLQYFSNDKDSGSTSIPTTQIVIRNLNKIHFQQYFQFYQPSTMDMNKYIRATVELSARSYQNKDELIKFLNQKFIEKKFPIQFKKSKQQTVLTTTVVFDDNKYDRKQSASTVTIPTELANILGYFNSDTEVEKIEFDLLKPNTPDWTTSVASDNDDDDEFMEDVESVDMETFKEFEITLPPDNYKSREQVVEYLNNKLMKHGVKSEFIVNPNHTKILSNLQFNNSKYNKEKSVATLSLSPNLSIMLGFNIEKLPTEFNRLTQKSLTTTFDHQLHIGLPSNLLIQLNIAQTRVVGKRHLPILQSLHITKSQIRPSILHFVMRENNVALLDTKLFSQVNVKITDIEGNEILAKNDYQTILHLNLVKWSSSR